jgi:hypothetical protein
MQVIRWQEAEQPQERELRSRMQQQGLAPIPGQTGQGIPMRCIAIAMKRCCIA